MKYAYLKDMTGAVTDLSQELRPIVRAHIPEIYRSDITGAVIDLWGVREPWFTEDAAPYSKWAMYRPASYWALDPDIDYEDLYGLEYDPRNKDTQEV